jgi:hypothetical protein
VPGFKSGIAGREEDMDTKHHHFLSVLLPVPGEKHSAWKTQQFLNQVPLGILLELLYSLNSCTSSTRRVRLVG